MPSNNYNVFKKFILRTHILPLNTLSMFQKTQINDEELQKIISNKVFLEAIYISSPILYSKILKWLNEGISNKKELDRLRCSLIKYLIRMSSRCTPYGLMASCIVGEISSETRIELEPYSQWKRKTYLDIDYLFLLTKDIERRSSIFNKIKFFPNSSIYYLNNRVRMVEYEYDLEKRKKYKIVSFESTEILLTVIRESRNGSTVEELANKIIDDDISIEDALSYIDLLVSYQILVSELEPTISGDDYLENLIKKLVSIRCLPQELDYIKNLQSKLTEIDKSELGESINMYNEAHKLANLNGINIDSNYLFNINLISVSKKCSLSNTISNRIIKVIKCIQSYDKHFPDSNLEEFKREFFERFEDREVSLSLVMDAESGIDYGKSANNNLHHGILNGLIFNDKKTDATTAVLTPFLEYILSLFSKAIYKSQKEISLNSRDLYEIINVDDSIEYHPTITAGISVYPGQDQGSEIIQLHWFAGPGARIFAKFGQSDVEIKKLIQEITTYEKNYFDDKIFAEVIHLPDGRVGNILIRPKTYDYEIPYLANSILNSSNQININDLTLSIKGDRIILKSKTLNKEVIPCLTSAQNYTLSSLPIYRFLCDLQHQNHSKGYGFNLSAFDDLFLFFPRVTIDGIIISPATWNINIIDIKYLYNIKDDSELIQQVDDWRNSIDLPKLVKLVDFDNELIIFFNNLLCIKMFLSLVKLKGKIKFKELLIDLKNDSIVQNENGFYNNEILLTYWKD